MNHNLFSTLLGITILLLHWICSEYNDCPLICRSCTDARTQGAAQSRLNVKSGNFAESLTSHVVLFLDFCAKLEITLSFHSFTLRHTQEEKVIFPSSISDIHRHGIMLNRQLLVYILYYLYLYISDVACSCFFIFLCFFLLFFVWCYVAP